jgi:murein DD-endopeptidase MepM/ murein hydrolase activator NlpD
VVDGRRQRRPGAIHIGIALSAALLLSGCFTSAPTIPPLYHSQGAVSGNRTYKVKRGDTIYGIARVYGVTSQRLMRANGIVNPRRLLVGEVLRIPAGHPSDEVAGASLWNVPRASRQFSWPVASPVVGSGFGVRNGVMHEGIDIDAPAGTPVHAADDGVVIYSGWLHGYGNVVIIRHSGGYATVYGHDKINLVSKGQHVTRGQVIGEVGMTGRATGPNLHFEVRHDNLAQNPIAYLPAPPPSNGVSFASSGGS